MLCYFVTSLVWEGIAPATIKTYLAAVRHAQIIMDHPQPRESSSLPRRRLVQNGIRRERTYSGQAPQSHLPLTPPLRKHPPPRRGCASLRGVYVVGGGNYVFFQGQRDHRSRCIIHLSWGYVSVSEDHRMLRVFLKRSKTDRVQRCLLALRIMISAARSYVAHRGVSAGAFFCLAGGGPLVKSRFVELVRSALTQARVPVFGYSGHSFRIGAATAAAEAGISDSVIQALGQWDSPAFLRYVRTPREQLARYSSPLANRS